MATEPAQSTHPYRTSSQPLIGKGWIQGVALVMIFGFLVMGILAYRTYTASMRGYRVEFRRDGATRVDSCCPMAHGPIHLSTRPRRLGVSSESLAMAELFRSAAPGDAISGIASGMQ